MASTSRSWTISKHSTQPLLTGQPSLGLGLLNQQARDPQKHMYCHPEFHELVFYNSALKVEEDKLLR